MQKLFFRNLAFLVALNVLIKPVWILGIDRTVQNVVGSENYGVYFVLFNLSFLTQILLDVGISNYNNRFIAQQEHHLTNYLSNIFSIKLMLAAVYLIVTLTIGWSLNYTGYRMILLLSICVNQLLASLIVYVRSNISALHHFKTDSVFSILDKALMIILCGSLLWIPAYRSQFHIEWFIYSQTVSYLITLAIAILVLLRYSGRFHFTFSWQFTLRLLKSTFPFALLILLMGIYSRIDGVMIEQLLPGDGEREAGIYASAFRLLDALNQFGYLFAVLLLPIFSRMLAKKHSVDELAKTSFTAIFIVSVTTSFLLCFFSKEIMSALYHEASDYSAQILSVLIFSFIGTCSVFIFGTLLTANGSMKELILISLFGVILNFTLNLFLIRNEKAYGAAQSAAVSNLTIAFLNFIMSVYIFKWRFNYLLIFRLLTYLILSWIIFYFLSRLSFNWIWNAIGAAVACVMIALLLRLIEIKKMFQILPSESM